MIDMRDFHYMKSVIYDAAAKQRPDLWARCYPKTYHEVSDGYFSVKEVAVDMMGAAFKIEQGYLGDNEKIEIMWASTLAKYRVPTYWVGKDIAEAIKQTKPHMTVDLQELHLPFEAMTFMIPRGTLVHAGDEGEAEYISFVRTHLNERVPSLATVGPGAWHQLHNGVLAIFAHSTAGHLLHWTLPNKSPVDLARLDDMVRDFEKEWTPHASEWPMYQEAMTETDNNFMAKVAHMIFGLILLMNARPLLVKNGQMVKRVHKKARSWSRPHEFWTASTIGADYKIKRLSIPQGGTHASPRLHWVRGHIKQQAFGPEHKLHKDVWVEPYLRGVDEEVAKVV